MTYWLSGLKARAGPSQPSRAWVRDQGYWSKGYSVDSVLLMRRLGRIGPHQFPEHHLGALEERASD